MAALVVSLTGCSHSTATTKLRSVSPAQACSVVDLREASQVVGHQLPPTPLPNVTPHPHEVANCEWNYGPAYGDGPSASLFVIVAEDTGDRAWAAWVNAGHDQCEDKPGPAAISDEDATAAYKQWCPAMNAVAIRQRGYFLVTGADPGTADPQATRLVAFAKRLARQVLPRRDASLNG